MNDFSNTLKEITRAQSIIDEIKEMAIELGAKAKGLHPVAAMNCLRKHFRIYVDFLKEAEELGTTLPNIMKGAKMKKNDSAVVPQRFRYAPKHWVRDAKFVNERHSKDGKTRTLTRRDKGVSPTQAQYLRKQIEPLMIDLFTAIQNLEREEDRKLIFAEIDHSYFNDSYGDFISKVHEYLVGLVTDWDIDSSLEEDDPDTCVALTEEEMLEQCLAGVS